MKSGHGRTQRELEKGEKKDKEKTSMKHKKERRGKHGEDGEGLAPSGQRVWVVPACSTAVLLKCQHSYDKHCGLHADG